MSTDKKAEELLEKIKKKKESVKKQATNGWKTSCLFYFDESNPKTQFNLHVLGTNQLVKILGFLIAKQNAINSAVELASKEVEFPISVEPDWLGCSIEDWKHDIINRIKVNESNAIRSKIEESERKVISLFSGEAKTKMQLDEIEKAIDGI